MLIFHMFMKATGQFSVFALSIVMKETLFSWPVLDLFSSRSSNLTKRLLTWTIDFFTQAVRCCHQGYIGLIEQVEQGGVQCDPPKCGQMFSPSGQGMLSLFFFFMSAYTTKAQLDGKHNLRGYLFLPPNFHLRRKQTILKAEAPRNHSIEMSTSTVKLQDTYNQQGFLSALPVLSDIELREAKNAFSELEREFGKCHWRSKEDEEGRGEQLDRLMSIS